MGHLVFLIGFMGCGKTYWGRKIADKTDWSFIDLDERIEAQAADTLPRIFENLGEGEFRIMEKTALQTIESAGNMLVATGGGVPCHFDNMDWMNRVGQTIYLKTPTPVLTHRLKKEQHLRPLLKSIPEHLLEERISALVAQREPYYLQAKLILEQSGGDDDRFEAVLLKAITGK